MALSNFPLTVSYLTCFLLVLFNLDSYYASALPNPVTPSKYCNINKHPYTNDLIGTSYIHHVRTATLPSLNRTYRYVHYHPDPVAQKPTILFLHGFPSSSFDWRNQFDFFASRGYGIVAPDILGFGGTDKPSDPAAYTLKKQAAEVVELLDCVTGGRKAVVVAHDLGSPVLSRLAVYYPDRFDQYVFLDIGYQAPGQLLTEAGIKANQERFGYQIFFNEDYSGSELDKHRNTIWSISYTNDEATYWVKDFAPTGALEASFRANLRAPTKGVATPEDEVIHNRIFSPKRGGYNPSLNQYRVTYRNLNLVDENSIPKSAYNLTKPTLLVTASKDPIGTPAFAEAGTRPYAPDLKVQEIISGHFLMLEKPHELNKALFDFFEG